MNSYIVTLLASAASPSVTPDECWDEYDPGVIHALLTSEPNTCTSGSVVMLSPEQATAAVMRPAPLPAPARRPPVPMPVPVFRNTGQQRTRQQTAQGAPQGVVKIQRPAVVSGGVQWA